VCLRLAPVFSAQAGILKKLLPIFNLGVGGMIGNGQQAFSWVSLEDVLRVVEYVTLPGCEVSGPVNVCSPNPVNNQVFTQAFAK
jgi:NAD dependent epimerase/dehydratase family enzyme